MDQELERLWEAMVAEFRALGGVVENVRLDDGPLGRGLFPIDPSLPTRVHVPESLLLGLKYCMVENGAFRVSPDAPVGVRERAFLEDYQRDFSWGVGHQYPKELLQTIEEAPPELRAFLESPLDFDRWLAGSAPESVMERFLSSRHYGKYKGAPVIMPMVELVNHGIGTQYEDDDGIAVGGQFSGEILVRYMAGDPVDFLETWGFASASEAFARSLRMELNTPWGPLAIKRDTLPPDPGEKPFYPEVSLEDGKMVLSSVLLGHKQMPGLPRSIFHQVMQAEGREGAEETFEMIQHVNRLQFYRLDALAESAAPLLGRILRDVARFQLEAMSHCIGTAPM